MSAPTPPELGALTETELHKYIAQRCFNDGLRAGRYAYGKQLRRAEHRIHELRTQLSVALAERDNALGHTRRSQ